ncbi:hypothetical protein M8C21_023832, partial [Ambrosia artemisiifolia]
MDASSIRNLCRHLISSAIKRCRTSGELCRLSVILKSSPLATPPFVRISISDTGVGSCVEEFQDVKHLSDSTLTELYGKKNFISNMELYQLQQPKVGIELIVDKGKFTEHQCVNAILANECTDLSPEENDACLKPGLLDYALKHGNQKDSICYSCFPTREHLKTGSGVVCRSKKNTETTIEAVVVVSELPELINPSCSRVRGSKTELNLPPAIKSTVDINLARKAVKLALTDLKEKNNGVLLSAHAVKIRSYAPDLAKTIAGLISTSNDAKFKGECASLLGLNSHDAISIEDNIKQKLFSVIDRNDREPQTRRMKENEHLLFNDDCFEEPEFSYEDYEEEISFSAFD